MKRKIVIGIILSCMVILNAQVFSNYNSIFNANKPSKKEIEVFIPQVISYLNQHDSGKKHISVTKVSFSTLYPTLYLTEQFNISTLYNSIPDTFINIDGQIICFYYSLPTLNKNLEYIERYDSIFQLLKWDEKIISNNNHLSFEVSDSIYNRIIQPNDLKGIYFIDDSLHTINEFTLLYFINDLKRIYTKRNPLKYKTIGKAINKALK